MLWLIVVAGLIVVGWGAAAYNGLVVRQNRVDNAWGQVEVQLRRRLDLIPNLIETVKGYAGHERDTLEAVVAARGRVEQASTPAETAQADGLLTAALRQVFALAEAYPQLRAAENFGELQSQLSETEDKISIARQIYNDSVLAYNNRVETIPTNFVARLAGFVVRDFYDAPEAADTPPEVTF